MVAGVETSRLSRDADVPTREQEFPLAERIQAGLSAGIKIMSSDGALSQEEIKILKDQMRDGINARDTLVMGHLGLIGWAINQYRLGVETPYDDIFQDGIPILIHVAEIFDPKKGPFTALARKILGQDLRKVVWGTHGLVHTPRSARQDMHKANQALKQLTMELGREPTPEEIAERAKVKPSRLKEIADAWQVDSLNQPSRGDLDEGAEELTLSDTLPSPNLPTDEQAIQNLYIEKMLGLAGEILTSRDRLVLHFVYDEGRTLREIGEELGISLSRVNQLHQRALKKLRSRLEEPQPKAQK